MGPIVGVRRGRGVEEAGIRISPLRIPIGIRGAITLKSSKKTRRVRLPPRRAHGTRRVSQGVDPVSVET